MTATLKVEELIHVINYEFTPKGRRRKRFPASFCYVCSQLGPRGRGFGPNNPYRHLFTKDLLRPCPHLPPAPHPTFVSDDEEDDGFDESWLGVGEEGEWEDGEMFDTSVVRDEAEMDPRVFSLPPVFGKADQPELKQKRRSKNGRLVPVVSEDTFVSTNKRGQGENGDPDDPKGGNDLHLPRLSDQRTSLVSDVEGHGQRNRKEKDPRRLHSERIDRRVSGVIGERMTQSDSAVAMDLVHSSSDLTREKTDPPPQPIVVSIKNQDGDTLQRIPMENLPPGTVPSEAFADRKEKGSRRRREKKRRPRSRNGSASPTFSGSMTISRETTLSGLESPDYFLSRLRSASWCECPEHVMNESRCPECRRVKDHEKWCVSRNTICPNCGKAFKRKYSHIDRKSSFGTIPASSMIISNIPSSGSPSRSAHPNCSPTKLGDRQSTHGSQDLQREASGNRVRFQEDGKVVFPQWEAFPDSGVEEDKDAALELSNQTDRSLIEGVGKSNNKLYLPSSLDPNIHQKAYNFALADAKLKAMFQKKKSARLEHPKGSYFSYFPLLKRTNPSTNSSENEVSSTQPQQTIGLRADLREGKALKVKKGLKHILGDVKVDDYYPGGKRYPK